MPKALLIHSAKLLEVSTENTWQSEETAEIATLKNIRIEPLSKLVTAKDNTQVTLTAVLFYDCKNSRPSGVSFKQGQKIIFNSIEYIVETIEPLYDGQKLHHYELGLI
ncbi:MAG: putative minor capsid protein [Oscillospiraceae bacterium]